MRKCEVRDLGRIGYAEAYALQRECVARRKSGETPDQLLIAEHPHVITLGRNANDGNVLASRKVLERAGVAIHETDRGGDVTYHGPGQVIFYPILDLREWKRDVGAYMRALERVIIGALEEFGLRGGRIEGLTGVWVSGGKIAAMGVHLSRWVTSHGFALNVDADLSYFQYIVPCGLHKPVTSMSREGSDASRAAVVEALVRNFALVFETSAVTIQLATERA